MIKYKKFQFEDCEREKKYSFFPFSGVLLFLSLLGYIFLYCFESGLLSFFNLSMVYMDISYVSIFEVSKNLIILFFITFLSFYTSTLVSKKIKKSVSKSLFSLMCLFLVIYYFSKKNKNFAIVKKYQNNYFLGLLLDGDNSYNGQNKIISLANEVYEIKGKALVKNSK